MEKKPASLRMLESLFECEQPHVDWLERSHEKAEYVMRREQGVKRRTSPEVSTQAAQQEVSELNR